MDEKEGLGGTCNFQIAPNSAILWQNVQKLTYLKPLHTACTKSSNQEGSTPLLSQLSTTVVRQLLDLKKEKCSKENVQIKQNIKNHKKERQRAYFGREECVDDKDKRLQRKLSVNIKYWKHHGYCITNIADPLCVIWEVQTTL